ncbi:MAG TPA: dUTP diphosphatase [Actinomycetota bacterium]|nr:dUTP diphosphatase [Actinomycetota bacterium]
MRVEVVRIDPDLPMPSYAHPGDAGLDLYAAEDVSLEPRQPAAVRTGIALAIPEGHAGFVLPRSGRALQEALGVVNSPGLIDAGYRGEVKVLLINHGPGDSIQITRGEKIAQLVIQKVSPVELVEVEELPSSQRGEGGFGSSGT